MSRTQKKSKQGGVGAVARVEVEEELGVKVVANQVLMIAKQQVPNERGRKIAIKVMQKKQDAARSKHNKTRIGRVSGMDIGVKNGVRIGRRGGTMLEKAGTAMHGGMGKKV